jgi:hypothetical protein
LEEFNTAGRPEKRDERKVVALFFVLSSLFSVSSSGWGVFLTIERLNSSLERKLTFRVG